MRHLLCLSGLSLLLMGAFLPVKAQKSSGFQITRSFSIPSPGGWDYISVGPDKKLYVSHGTQVNILDQQTGDSVGVLQNTTGVHGIAFDENSGRGFTSNGRLNTVTVFDIKTTAVLQQVATGKNPDAIFFEPFSKQIITCNGGSHDLTLIDPANGTVKATIPLEGKPETAVSDNAGHVFVNIEDKNSITEIDIRKNTIIAHWPLNAEGPTGLAIDPETHRLFAGCDGKMVVVDALKGSIIATLPIGDGCDGVGFDPGLKMIFASCGEGKLTIISEGSANQYTVIDNVPTKRSARTLAVDTRTHQVYLPAADTQAGATGERPRMIPGTFQILVAGQNK